VGQFLKAQDLGRSQIASSDLAELKIFWRPQASQATEKVDSARENPRKTKSAERSPDVHFGAAARPGDHIQTQYWLQNGGGAIFSPLPPYNPLKTNDRRRFAAENGGRLSASFKLPSVRNRAARGRAAPGPTIQRHRIVF
jgi:hypothetical protein